MSTSTPSKKIVLRTSDAETFVVAETVAKESHTIKAMIEDGCADAEIPLPNVTGGILAKVIEYLDFHHGRDRKRSTELKSFDSAFVKVDKDTLFDLIMAANYLDIKSMLDLTCQAAADMIKNKSPRQIRNIFNLEYDFTPEEEEELRRESEWPFDFW